MKKIMLKVKPFQETLHASMCGPASLKIIFGYYGMDIAEKKLARLAGTVKRGTSERGFIQAAEKLGFKCKIKNNSSFSDIEKWLKKGIPVIVDWFTRGRADYPDSEVADGHYSVAIGLDTKHIYLQDPEIGRVRKILKRDFLRVWFDYYGDTIKPNELVIRQTIIVSK